MVLSVRICVIQPGFIMGVFMRIYFEKSCEEVPSTFEERQLLDATLVVKVTL
eukprot:m.1649385 g.1649385  ORF g.1649385 m.1649385 type:complete len:52 (-) comp82767_c0_seq1:287-442(-)